MGNIETKTPNVKVPEKSQGQWSSKSTDSSTSEVVCNSYFLNYLPIFSSKKIYLQSNVFWVMKKVTKLNGAFFCKLACWGSFSVFVLRGASTVNTRSKKATSKKLAKGLGLKADKISQWKSYQRMDFDNELCIDSNYWVYMVRITLMLGHQGWF